MIEGQLESSSPGAPAAADVAHSWRLVPASAFESHRHSWDAVFHQVPRPPILDSTFMRTALRIFGEGNEVLAICGEASAPVAIGVFRRVGPGAWETFQPAQAPLSAWMHDPAVSYENLLAGLMGALPGLPLIIGITQKDPNVHSRPPETARLKVLDYIHTARITVDRPFTDYWKERDKKVRYEIQRRLKRLAEAGMTPRLEVLRAVADVPAAIETYGRIESQGWKGRAGTAVRSDNEQGMFYQSVLSEYCARGQGRIYRLFFGDQPVAMQLCIENQDTLVFLKTAYDENHRRYSPGILLKHAIFEHVFGEGRLKTIEFFGALLEWQERWSGDVRTLYHVNYYRWPWLVPVQRLRSSLAARAPAEVAEDASDETDATPANHHARGNAHAGVAVYDSLSAVPERYENLFRRAGRTSIFHTLPWYRNFVANVIGPDERLRVFAVETASRKLRGLLMMQHRAATGGLLAANRLTGMANYYTSLFGPVLDPDERDIAGTLGALAQAIARDSVRWSVVDMHPMAVDDATFPAMEQAFRNAGFLVHRYFCFGNWYLPVNGQSFEQYFDGRSSRLSKTGRRQRRKLDAGGRFRYRLYTGLDGLAQGLADYQAVYGSSWKTSEPYPNFIGGLMQTCAAQGWLRLGVAYMDEQPAAAQLWIVADGTASIFKMAYDERYAKDSVGTVLSSMLMERAFEVDKVETVDYLTGDDPYKRDWMSSRRERWGLRAFNLRTPYGLFAASRHLAESAVKQVVRIVRDKPGQQG